MRVGVDVGGSLTKVAIEDDGARQYRLLEYTDPDKVAALIPQTAHVYATGCGARELAARLQSPVKVLDELECFCAGARHLVQEQGLSTVPFVLASLGTGTSIFHVTQESGTRVTGTGVGGGDHNGTGTSLAVHGGFCRDIEPCCPRQAAEGGPHGKRPLQGRGPLSCFECPYGRQLRAWWTRRGEGRCSVCYRPTGRRGSCGVVHSGCQDLQRIHDSRGRIAQRPHAHPG